MISTNHPTIVGGAETHLQIVIPAIRGRGHDVALLTTAPVDVNRPLVAPPDMVTFTGADRPVTSTMADVAEWKPDIVYGHGSTLDEALAAKFPMVYFAHNYRGTCVSGTKCHAFPGFKTCHRRMGAGCLVLYGPRRCGGLNPVTAVRMYWQGKKQQRALLSFAAVVVDSCHMAREMHRNGVPAERVHVNPPFPTDVAPDSTPPVMRPFSGRILMGGRLTKLKGWSHLVAALPMAAAQLARALTLVVTGDGPDRQPFEDAARRAGLAAEFHGWVKIEQRNAEMRAADLVAVPSVWPEPFGLVGIEAGCKGTPAVGYAAGGIPDWLIPGVSGESAPGDRPDARQLAAAFVRAISDPVHWQRLRLGAWETARTFSVNAHVDRLLPILRAAAQ